MKTDNNKNMATLLETKNSQQQDLMELCCLDITYQEITSAVGNLEDAKRILANIPC